MRTGNAVICGTLKHQLIRQFISEVQWGALDYLVWIPRRGPGMSP